MAPPKRDFLAVTDLTRDEILRLFDLAGRMKAGSYRDTPLAGKTLAMIFAKSSTRTRVSFEVGAYQLGGQALFLSSRHIQIGRGEPIPDTARVLSRYVGGIMIRTFHHADAEELARHASIPEAPEDAGEGAHVVNTDVWASMGQEEEAESRRNAFRGYTVNPDLMKLADPKAIFLHCLPAHRGEEVSADVIEGPQSRVWDEAENRLHVQKALLATLMG